jgi:hypothetical protein
MNVAPYKKIENISHVIRNIGCLQFNPTVWIHEYTQYATIHSLYIEIEQDTEDGGDGRKYTRVFEQETGTEKNT